MRTFLALLLVAVLQVYVSVDSITIKRDFQKDKVLSKSLKQADVLGRQLQGEVSDEYSGVDNSIDSRLNEVDENVATPIEAEQIADDLWESFLIAKAMLEAAEDHIAEGQRTELSQTIAAAMSETSDISAKLTEVATIEETSESQREIVKNYLADLKKWATINTLIRETLLEPSFLESITSATAEHVTTDKDVAIAEQAEDGEDDNGNNDQEDAPSENIIKSVQGADIVDVDDPYAWKSSDDEFEDNNENEEAIFPGVPGSGMLSASGLDPDDPAEHSLLQMIEEGVSIPTPPPEEIMTNETIEPSNSQEHSFIALEKYLDEDRHKVPPEQQLTPSYMIELPSVKASREETNNERLASSSTGYTSNCLAILVFVFLGALI